MYSLTRPTEKQIQTFLSAHQNSPFSYAEVGASRGSLPAGYTIDHNRIQLGLGAETFAQAKAALCRWEMFHFDWLQLCWPTVPVQTGSTVAVMVRAGGLWWLNPCRIVYVLAEEGPVERFGFAYGTLPTHVERGEERFSVEWYQADDSVWYDILAFSRPNHFLAKMAYPYARTFQKRFAVDSLQAMRRATGSY